MKGDRPVRVDAFAVTVVDTNGAGDTHSGVFLAELASGTDVIEAAIAGVGLALVPTWMLQADALQGKLRPILQDWRLPPRPISVVYPSRRFLAPRTRAVIDFLVEEFKSDPMIQQER